MREHTKPPDAHEVASGLRMTGRRLSELVESALARDADPDQARVALQELSTGIEELRVAEEELTIQAEQLAASQLAIDAERERYVDLFEFAPDAYLETDGFGKILEANSAAGALLGVPARFLRGKLVQSFVAPADRPAVRGLLARAVEGGGPATVEVELEPRDLPLVEVEVRAGSHFDAATGPDGEFRVRWLLRDITERRKLDRDLRQLHADVELLEALSEVNRLVAGQPDPLEPMLRGLLELAASAAGGAHSAITLSDERGRVEARVASDEVAEELCRVQLQSGGPTTEVLGGALPRVDKLADLARWPDLADAVRHHGLEWVISHPIAVPGDGLPGVLNLYGCGSVDAVARAVQAVAEHAAGVVANGRLYRSATELAGHLERALESRGVIEQAKGILMAWQGCDADRAFDILRRASQRENRKLRTIAEDLVEKAARGGGRRG